ncbi:MAG: sigma 54-interacting transcriptional regulator [Mailhella sp.]|nr:sigma 54-interacting transcriptional regulator [Mailhella sp.]
MSESSSFYPSVEDSYYRLLAHIPGIAYRCRVDKVLESDGGLHLDYRLEFASKGSRELLGVDAKDLMASRDNSIERMTHPDDLQAMRRDICEHVLAHQSYQVMYRIILPDGKTKWIWDQGEGVFGRDGELWFIEGLMMDVSEQKFMEMSLREENRRLRGSSDKLMGLGGLVGQSEAMRRVYELMIKASSTDTSVIIYGETGSGKDVVARTIHSLSGRKGAYVPVNCGAIPENLLESEFFGHVKGAFTGAASAKEGYIAAANGGTLFLDEIGELPHHLQVKLLRALENRSYTPVGGNTPRTSDFRLISATNQDIRAMVREKKMRADFYYRINVLSITVPPLRERLSDLPLLIAAWKEKRGLSIDIPLSVNLAMSRYDWPGNIRELQNFLDRYAAFGEAALESLGGAAMNVMMEDVAETCTTLEAAVLRLEEKLIRGALEACRWNRGEAAARLGINLRTLQRRMKAFGLGRSASAGDDAEGKGRRP